MVARPLRRAALGITALAAVLVFPLVHGGQAARGTSAQDGRSSVPYLLAGAQSTSLVPLDPGTLATVSGGGAIPLGGAAPAGSDRRVLASRDGSTLAVLSVRDVPDAPPSTADISIRVYDLTHHVRRPAYHPAVAIDPWGMGISPDGTQLFGLRLSPAGLSLGWYVLDAATGTVRRRMPFVRPCCSASLYDAVRQRLYLLDDSTGSGSTPSAAGLTAYDVGTRRVVGRLDLPGVVSGSWETGRLVEGRPVMALWAPGLALSPDGSQIAVVAANDDTVHLIDTRRLAIARTESLPTPSSDLLGRLGSWLGLVPTGAEAKEMEGVMLAAAYSPDGRSLFVTGMQGQVDPSGSFAWHGLGLRVVDVGDGHITARSLAGEGVRLIQDAPGGGAVYTLSPRRASPEDEACPCTLRRLDPATLDTLAERRFAAHPVLVVANPWGGRGRRHAG